MKIGRVDHVRRGDESVLCGIAIQFPKAVQERLRTVSHSKIVVHTDKIGVVAPGKGAHWDISPYGLGIALGWNCD